MNSDDYDDAKLLQGDFQGPTSENYGQGPKGRRKKYGKKVAWESDADTSWGDQLPHGRHWHTSSLCKDYNGFGHLIIFGEIFCQGPHWTRRRLELSTTQDSIWSGVSHKNSSSLRIEPRYSHTAVVVEDVHGSISSPGKCIVYVFGGTTRSVQLNRLMWITCSNTIYRFGRGRFTRSSGMDKYL